MQITIKEKIYYLDRSEVGTHFFVSKVNHENFSLHDLIESDCAGVRIKYKVIGLGRIYPIGDDNFQRIYIQAIT
jgi:hypothetical protein